MLYNQILLKLQVYLPSKKKEFPKKKNKYYTIYFQMAIATQPQYIFHSASKLLYIFKNSIQLLKNITINYTRFQTSKSIHLRFFKMYYNSYLETKFLCTFFCITLLHLIEFTLCNLIEHKIQNGYCKQFN